MSDERTWQDASEVLKEIADALERFDWREVEMLCRSGKPGRTSLLQRLESATEPLPSAVARDLLRMLRRKRRFELMGIMADGIHRSDPTDAEIRRQYGQAMIDQGNLTAAENTLKEISADPQAPPREIDEANGLLGRIYKQLYVNACQPTNLRQQNNLAKATGYYWRTYKEKPDKLWHGVNVLALRARARRDQAPGISADVGSEEVIADNLLQSLSKKDREQDELGYFDLAVGLETEVARWDFIRVHNPELAQQHARNAAGWLARYLRDRRVDAFECASTLRQLREVWELNPATPPGDILINGLQAALLQREGGEIQLQGSDCRMALEKNFSAESDIPLLWWQTGLKRCMAVARIESGSGRAVGTGFLVHGPDFFDDVGDTPVLLTNWHVVSKGGEHPMSIAPEGAIAFFEGVGKRFAVKSILAYSRTHDATFLALENLDPASDFCPLKPAAIPFDAAKKQRLYIIGHPGGRSVSFSLFDSIWLDTDGRVLHYRTPTEGGSSGSAVFDQENWTLVALHHAGMATMPRLHGQTGTYQSNEGISITAIQNTIRLNRMS